MTKANANAAANAQEQQAAQQQPCALFLAHHRSCNIIRYFPGGIRTKIHFFPCKLHGLKFPVLLYMFP